MCEYIQTTDRFDSANQYRNNTNMRAYYADVLVKLWSYTGLCGLYLNQEELI